MLGSCVAEPAQDLSHHGRPLASSAPPGAVPLRVPLQHHQAPPPPHPAPSPHHHQLHLNLMNNGQQQVGPHHHHYAPQQQQQQAMSQRQFANGGYPTRGQQHMGGPMQPLAEHYAAQTPNHHPREGLGSSSGSSSSSPASSSPSATFMDYRHGLGGGMELSPPSSSSSTSSTGVTMAPVLPTTLQQQRQQQHRLHQQHQHAMQHQAGQMQVGGANVGTNQDGFLQQLLHEGMPTDEDLNNVSAGGASLSLMTAAYHGSPQAQQAGMSYQPGMVPPHATGTTGATPTNSNEELPCIFDELEMFQENATGLMPTCFAPPPAIVPQHHHVGAMDTSNSGGLQLLPIATELPPPLPTGPIDESAIPEEMMHDGSRRRKLSEVYPSEDPSEYNSGRRGSAPVLHHPPHHASGQQIKRLRYNRRPSTSSSPTVKPEPHETCASVTDSISEGRTIDIEDIHVGVRDQVVYWGNSKNKYDVTVCVRAPSKFCGLLKGASLSYHVSLPAAQDFKMKSRSSGKGKSKQKNERDVKKATLRVARTEPENGMIEYEASLKNCLPMEKLSNLTLLELHFTITPKVPTSKPEKTKAEKHEGNRQRGGRKLTIDDEEYEDDGRDAAPDDEDEYVPDSRGKSRGRGHKSSGRGGRRGSKSDHQLESDIPEDMDTDLPFSVIGEDGQVVTIKRKVPVVTYTHSKAITRALCRLIWYPVNEESTMPTDMLLDRLCKYYESQLQLPISIYDRQNLAAMLSPYSEGISYVDFYSLLGEWFVLAIKMAKKKTQWLWQQGRESYIPLLFNPYRRFSVAETTEPAPAPVMAPTGAPSGTGDDDEWTEEGEEAVARRNGRVRSGRRSRSGSRAGLPLTSSKGKESESSMAESISPSGTIAALDLCPVLERKGDFLITVGPELKERNHGRCEGEEGRGVNYFPSLKYPLQIVYMVEDREPSSEEVPSGEGDDTTAQPSLRPPVTQCLSVENKLDKLTDFIHAKGCLQDYLVLQRDGTWKRVPKDKFGFNHAQQRRLEETMGQTSVLPRDESESLSYAHA